MLQVKRIGHATLTTPDLERQLDYYTRVLGLCTVAREKNRAILATKPGQEAIVLEHGDRPAGVRLAFQVAPGSDLGELSARLSKAGLKSETRSDITPGIAQAIVFADPKGTSVDGRVLHRSRPDARRGARLFRAAAVAPGPAAAAEGLGRRHPHQLLEAGTSARHAGAEKVAWRSLRAPTGVNLGRPDGW